LPGSKFLNCWTCLKGVVPLWLAEEGSEFMNAAEPQQRRFSEGNRQKDTEQYHIFSFDRLRVPDSV